MPIFKNPKVMESLFGDLWTRMINETDFGSSLRQGGLSIFFVTEDPEVVMYLDADGPLFGEKAKSRIPMVTMRMSGDTAHKFWLRQINVPKALALGQIKAKGSVEKVLQLLPMLKTGFDLYPDYCRKYNLPLE